MHAVSDHTLYAILAQAGILTSIADACVAGRLPRTFGGDINATFAWKIRDAYYWLAEASIAEAEDITLTAIICKIMPEFSLNAFAIDAFIATVQGVTFKKLTFKNYTWQSPDVENNYFCELMTALRLYYIYTIWQNNPCFREADFSSALKSFDNGIVAEILSHIEPVVPELTADELKLLNFLAEEPRSRRAIEDYMNIKRSTLLKKYLSPARDAGLVTTTIDTTPSSPVQRYMLTKAGQQVVREY